MTPTIVLRNGKPFMLTGSPGSATIISSVLGSFLNVVDFGMNMQQAVNAPRLHQQWYPDVVYAGQGLLTPESQKTLEAMGYTFKQFSGGAVRSEEHTSELQSLMRISYAVFCLKKQMNNSATV